MRVVAFDTETSLIRPALMAPPLVCVTWQFNDGSEAQIEHHSRVEPTLRSWLEDPEIRFVGHNVAFDFAVIAERFQGLRDLIFRAYAEDRVTDTMLRMQLLDIAGGCLRGHVNAKGHRIVYKYGLADLAKRCAGMELSKDAWRMSYEAFLDVPIEDWPARARDVQAKARDDLRTLEAEIEAAGKDKDAVKDLTKKKDDLLSMIEGVPERCTQYALEDARATLAVYKAQEVHAARYLADQYRQARAYFGLHLSSAWGLCVDAEGVRNLREQVEAEQVELEALLVEEGLVRPDGTQDMRACKLRMVQVCRELGIPIIRTDAHPGAKDKMLTVEERQARGLKPLCKLADGTPLDDGSPECEEHVCLDSDACERTDDPTVVAIAEWKTAKKQLTNDIPMLEGGQVYPLHTRYGLAATGRSTSSAPNIQNMSNRSGFREAFVARPGYVFVQNDYPTLELYTLAQCCITWFGYSKLAEALRMGDPHLWVASIILGKPLDWCILHKKDAEVKLARKQAKPLNFGLPGGMGIKTFVNSTRKSVIKMEGRSAWEELGLVTAEDPTGATRTHVLKEQWLTAFPEMRGHFERIQTLTDTDDGLAMVETLFTGRWRGKATYCATANNGFQALGADCAKNAVWKVAEAQYTKKDSPLFDARTVAFIHDEIILECRNDGRASDVAWELARVMADAANEFLPDIPIPFEKMEPTIMHRWSKKAYQVFDADGRLMPWDGERTT